MTFDGQFDIYDIRFVINCTRSALTGITPNIKRQAAEELSRILPKCMYHDCLIAGHIAKDIPEIIDVFEKQYSKEN